MSKLLKFLKPYAGAVVAILCVLIVQAYCDLSLPGYTSDIVNVGIQQGGIDESVPEYIGEEDFNKLLMLIPSRDRQTVQEAYETDDEDSYDYEGVVYRLKSSILEDEEQLRELADIMGKPMLFELGFESESDMPEEMKAQMQMPMEDSQRDAMLDQMYAQMEDMPETMTEQAATSYIRIDIS